jgi:hypothetical protein
MRGGVAAAAILLALLSAAPLADAGSKLPMAFGSSMTVTASPHAAGARGVRLTVTLRYEMQCGYPGAGALVVTFPRAVKLPARFPAASVRLAGRPVVARVRGRKVTVRVGPHKGLMCDLIGPGSLKLAFTQAAKLANPGQAGSYRFTATHHERAFTAMLAIKPGS